MLSHNEQDLIVHDAIVNPDQNESVMVAEVLCNSREDFARLWEVVRGDDQDFHINNARLIIKEAQRLMETLGSLISENVGENEIILNVGGSE
jgi:hypothetical protein